MNEKKQIFSGSFDDMLAAFLATYALASFSYEKYMPESFMRIFSFAVLTLFAAAWLWFSFRSGLRNGKKFPLFAILFWILPHIIIYLADNGPEFMRMSIAMYILSEFSGSFRKCSGNHRSRSYCGNTSVQRLCVYVGLSCIYSQARKG